MQIENGRLGAKGRSTDWIQKGRHIEELQERAWHGICANVVHALNASLFSVFSPWYCALLLDSVVCDNVILTLLTALTCLCLQLSTVVVYGLSICSSSMLLLPPFVGASVRMSSVRFTCLTSGPNKFCC